MDKKRKTPKAKEPARRRRVTKLGRVPEAAALVKVLGAKTTRYLA
jgi:hypothetical protein